MRPTALGFIFVVVSVSCYGTIPSIAWVSYEGGSNPITLLLFRTFFVVVFILAWNVLSGRTILLPRSVWIRCAILSLCMTGVSIGTLSAVLYIPVGVASTVFYLFPIFIALLTAALGQTRIRPATILSLILAFLGIVLIMEASFSSLSWVGIGFSLLAAVSAAVMFILSSSLFRENSIESVLLFSNAASFIVVTPVALLLDQIRLPQVASEGLIVWSMILLVCLLFLSAIWSQSAAIKGLGELRAGTYFNLEPVVAIAVAYVFLDQSLTVMQLSGAATIIGALILAMRASSFESAAVPVGARTPECRFP